MTSGSGCLSLGGAYRPITRDEPHPHCGPRGIQPRTPVPDDLWTEPDRPLPDQDRLP